MSPAVALAWRMAPLWSLAYVTLFDGVDDSTIPPKWREVTARMQPCHVHEDPGARGISFRSPSPREFRYPESSFCQDAQNLTSRWQRVCTELQDIWARGEQAVHYAIHGPSRWRGGGELSELTATHVVNAGDSVLPMAARLVLSYFLGHPRWRLHHVTWTSSDEEVERVNRGDCTALMMVGGGGLFYPENPNSQQNRSGWQWDVSADHLARFRPPLLLMGVGWNQFRSPHVDSTKVPLEGQYGEAFSRSLRVMASRSVNVIGLRESYSLDALSHLFRGARAHVVYQPCSTTLVGAVQPCLAQQGRPPGRVLSVNVARDRMTSRLGRRAESVLEELARWCEWAHAAGWTVHMTQQQGGDSALAKYMQRTRPGYPVQRIDFRSRTDVYEYYRTVDVAVSMRGHGIMVPFGLRVPTISLVTHEKVAAFIDDIGHPEWGVEISPYRRPGATAEGIANELWQALEYIDANRAQVVREIVEAQAHLMAVTARNMLLYGESILRTKRALPGRRHLRCSGHSQRSVS